MRQNLYLPLLIALCVASLADALMGNSASLVLYIAAVGCANYFGNRWTGICAVAAAMAVWTFINQTELAGSGYAILSLKLLVTCLILLSSSLLIAFLSNRSRLYENTLYTDILTGLYNMKAFRDITSREINRCSRYGHPFSLAYLDLDNFSTVNNTVGHTAGDELLVSIANTLRCNVRKSDTVAHLGGDNFVMLLPESGNDQAKLAMIKIKTKLDEAVAKKGYFITFSIGLITCITPPASLEEVLSEAEAVMYRVKSNGKNAIRHEPLSSV